MAGTDAMRFSAEIGRSSQNGAIFGTFSEEMTPAGDPRDPYEIRSAARGPHWIAWIVCAGSEQPDRPHRAVVLVGETREEAEARARLFAEQSSY